MQKISGRLGPGLAASLVVVVGTLGLGCANKLPRIGDAFVFFAPANADDPFHAKFVDWQRRSHLPPERSAIRETTSRSAYPFGVLEDKFDVFLAQHRRSLARDFTAWSQRQSRFHFKPDPDSTLAGDHWPTREEFFLSNGDDCDGLDLIAYGLLRDAGFGADEIYRLVVRREKDGANHMVTLWFEDPQDPWVIDATGAMTLEMRKFSDLPPGWLPRVMFNENEIYNVVDRRKGHFELARDRADAPEETQ
jgi:hypothetical protein